MHLGLSLTNGIIFLRWRLSIVLALTEAAWATAFLSTKRAESLAADAGAGTEAPCAFGFVLFAFMHSNANTPRLPAIRKEIVRICLHYVLTLSRCPHNTICPMLTEWKDILEASPSARSVSIKFILRKRATDLSLC